MFTVNQPPEKEYSSSPGDTSKMPIWAPNPGVPIAARILAYLFGILMIFTVIISIFTLRPADIPAIPKPSEWRTYSTSDFSISFPGEWAVDEFPISGGMIKYYLRFYPIPDQYIRVSAFAFQTNRPFVDGDIEEITAFIEEKLLSKEFKNYTRGKVVLSDDFGDYWHLFDGTMTDEEKRPVTGAWLLKVQGSRALFLEAISPKTGWDNMSKLFSTMSESVVFVEDNNPLYGSY